VRRKSADARPVKSLNFISASKPITANDLYRKKSALSLRGIIPEKRNIEETNHGANSVDQSIRKNGRGRESHENQTPASPPSQRYATSSASKMLQNNAQIRA